MFSLVLQIIFSHPAVIFLKILFISSHCASTLPTSSIPKFDGLHANATKYCGKGCLSHQPAVQRATSLTQSSAFIQLENMPRLLRKQIDFLTCFHHLCCLLHTECCVHNWPIIVSLYKKILTTT